MGKVALNHDDRQGEKHSHEAKAKAKAKEEMMEIETLEE